MSWLGLGEPNPNQQIEDRGSGWVWFWGKNALDGESTVFSGQVGLTKDAENQRMLWKTKAQPQPPT